MIFQSRWTSFPTSLLAGIAASLAPTFILSQAIAQSAPAASTLDRAHIEQVLEGLNPGHSVGRVAVSPDGKQIAWIQGSRGNAEILVAPFDDLKKSQQVTAAAKPDQHCNESDFAWEPDSKALAFFSDCAQPGEQDDLYVARFDGNAPRRVTELKGYVNAPAFSPDGSKIAFLYVEGATRPAGALAAMKPPSGVIGEDDVEIQRVAVTSLQMRRSQRSNDDPGQSARVRVRLGARFQIPGLRGRRSAGREQLVGGQALHAAARRRAQSVLAPAEVSGPLHGLQIAVPRWSPDGKAIAFIGGLMSDQGSTGGDVWIVSADGGQPRDLSQGRPTSPAWIEWDGNDHLYVSELAGGNCQLIRYHLQGDRVSPGGMVNFGSPDLQHSGQRGRRTPRNEPFLHCRSLAVRLPRQHLRPSNGDLRGQAGQR